MSIIQRINKFSVSNVLFIALAIAFMVFPAGNSKIVNAAGCDLGIFVRPSSQTVVSGSGATISWDSVNCSNIRLTVPLSSDQSGPAYVTYSEPAFGSYSTGTLSYRTNPTTYTYQFSATNPDGSSMTSAVTITVVQQAAVCQLSSFTAFPLSITAGNSTKLSWSSSNCSSFTLSDSNGNSQSITNTNSSITEMPTVTTTYTLTDGTSANTLNQTVTVSAASACQIVSFSASPNPTNVGSSTTISWDTANCAAVGLSGPNYPVKGEALSGSKTVTPIDGDTWNLAAGPSLGNLNVTATPLVLHTVAQCSITSFSATNFNSGSPTTLSWVTNNCTSATISGGNLGTNTPVSPASSGSITDTPSATTTYYLHALNSVNVATAASATATMNATTNCALSLHRSVNASLTFANPPPAYHLYMPPGGTQPTGEFSNLTVPCGIFTLNYPQDLHVSTNQTATDGASIKASTSGLSSSFTLGSTNPSTSLTIPYESDAILEIH